MRQRKHRLGWRIQVTDAPTTFLSLSQAVVHYRGGWRLERDFHLVKGRPIGISPLYVRLDDQIISLTRLLTLVPSMLEQVLEYLGLSSSRYRCLAENSP